LVIWLQRRGFCVDTAVDLASCGWDVALEHRMTLRLGGIVVTAFGAFATIVKLF
jgi:hypothetical protein